MIKQNFGCLTYERGAKASDQPLFTPGPRGGGRGWRRIWPAISLSPSAAGPPRRRHPPGRIRPGACRAARPPARLRQRSPLSGPRRSRCAAGPQPGLLAGSRHADAEQVLTSRAVPLGSALRKSAARRRRPCSATSATRWMTLPVGQARGSQLVRARDIRPQPGQDRIPSQPTSIIPDQPRAMWTLNPQAGPFQVEVIELPL